MEKKKALEIIALYVYSAVAAVLAITFKLNFLQATLLYTLPPIIYCIFRLKGYIKKIALESLVIAIPLEIVFDYIAHVSNSWYVPSTLGIRVFGAFPLDDIIWTSLYIFLIILLYEYFFDKRKNHKLPKTFKKLVILLSILITVFLFILILAAQSFIIPYFYFWLMLILGLLNLVAFLRFPNLYNKISLTAVISLVPSFIFEFLCLKMGYWFFMKGNHIGYINISEFTFPVEELMFYVIAIMTTLLLHEIFADNRKN